MVERTGDPRKGIGRFADALSGRVRSARERYRIAKTPQEVLRSSALKEARERALTTPTYDVLKANLDFQTFRNGERSPFAQEEVTEVFRAIGDNKPVNPYMYQGVWLESVIDPTLDREVLKEKSIDYCRGTANYFVDNARAVARFLSESAEPAEDNLRHAIGSLIGTSIDDQDTTIFKDQSWSMADYTPDFIRLGVNLEEIGISEEKVMASVALCIGLWIKLADLDTTRPVSGHKFAPVFNHCSFIDLVTKTGWEDYNGAQELFLGALVDRKNASGGSIRDEFLSQFRNPNFFQKTHDILT